MNRRLVSSQIKSGQIKSSCDRSSQVWNFFWSKIFLDPDCFFIVSVSKFVTHNFSRPKFVKTQFFGGSVLDTGLFFSKREQVDYLTVEYFKSSWNLELKCGPAHPDLLLKPYYHINNILPYLYHTISSLIPYYHNNIILSQ